MQLKRAEVAEIMRKGPHKMRKSRAKVPLTEGGVAASPPHLLLLLLFLLLLFSLETTSFSSPQLLLLPGAVVCPGPVLDHRPVVGILTHPGDGASGRITNASGASYIAASYVKFVESAGARVVPIIYNEPWEAIEEKLSLVNGVLFTGGWAKRGGYFETARQVFEKVLERNDAGEYFPLFAICLGFELLNMIISKDTNILERFNATYQASTLQFTTTELQETVFQGFPPELLWKVSTICLAMQNHKYGVSPERILENKALSSFFKILTTSIDANNKEYVSTVQAYNYPVTGFQWHPETCMVELRVLLLTTKQKCTHFFVLLDLNDKTTKNAFEWGYSMIPHSEDAIQVTQLTANFFISETRKSSVRPPLDRLLKLFIYNYPRTYSGSEGSGFDEVYIFT